MSDVNERNPNQGRPQMPQYPPPQRRRSSNWWIPLVIIGAIILLFVVFVAVIATNFKSAFEPEQVVIKENSVLTITLDGSLPEKTESNPFAFFAGENTNPATFWETLKAIELAKDDDKIKGIYLKPSLSGVSYSKLVEFHEALDEFKKSGKFIYGFLEVGSENQYFAMLPADTLFSPKEGMIEFNGFNATSMFFKDMLKKIGVEYHVEHFEDFKSAANSFVETGYTDSARYQLRVLLEQQHNNFVDAIGKYRGIDKEKTEKLLEYGYITADSLYKHGLLDVLVAETTVKEFVKARALGQEFENPLDIQNAELVDYKESGDEKIKFVSVNSYLAGDRPSVEESEIHDPDKRIAIINAVGPIVSMSSSAFGGEPEIVSGQLVKHLREARKDEKIAAIILRVNSPGGSVIASDEIWEEVKKTRAVKPVYASMSSVAASGGYYISMACDTIIAHPSTITGSIGVVLAIPNFSETLDMVGVSVDTISTSPAASFMNPMMPFTEFEKEKLHKMSVGIYHKFVSKVAESRGMAFEETRALAKGRVWTGEDAYEKGLVDVLGGLGETLEIVKNRLGVPDGKKVYVEFYPKPKDDLEELLNAFGLGSQPDDGFNVKKDLQSVLGVSPEQILARYNSLPEAFREQFIYSIKLSEMSSREKVLMAMPGLPHIQ